MDVSGTLGISVLICWKYPASEGHHKESITPSLSSPTVDENPLENEASG